MANNTKYVLFQVVATVDETKPLDKQSELTEDGLDNDLAAHINSKMADLALSTEEKQVLSWQEHNLQGCSNDSSNETRRDYILVF